MNVTIVIGLPAPGSQVETNRLANSELFHENTWYGGPEATFTMPEWRKGDQFALSIPSGIFEGRVYATENYGPDESAKAVLVAQTLGGPQPATEGIRLWVEGVWNGRDGGISGGLCAFGSFKAITDAHDCIVTESTLIPEGKVVPYGVYEWAKSARHLLGISNDGARALIEHFLDKEEGKVYDVLFTRSNPPVNGTLADQLTEMIG